MLVLARKVGQSIVIGDDVELMIIEVRGDQVRLGVTAPKEIPVHRKELLEQIKQENLMAAAADTEAAIEVIKKADQEPSEEARRFEEFRKSATNVAKKIVAKRP